jgi:YVTN family beta-propeller protein
LSASANSRIGTELAGYRIEALIGRGGMGVVYRAHDLALDRDVALKLLAPHLADDISFRERFLRESRLAASLEHPNVVPIHDAGEIDGQLYIAMRFVEGSDLKAVLHQGPLEPPRAVRILEQVAGALDAAHARGLVHRDVKPSNVLIDGREHVYLADFGLSRYLGDAATPLGPAKSLGTAAYVAPEQIRGEEVDGRADVYALGCLLYECLAGKPPFQRGSDAATLYAHLEEPPPTLPSLEQVLPKGLAKEPADRYQTCSELVDAARGALGIAQPARSRWPLAVAAVGVALIAAALAAFFLTRGGGGPKGVPGGDTLVRIDPATNAVAGTIPIGQKTSAVAVGGEHVWATSFADGSVWRIDPGSKATLRIPTRGSPTDVAVVGGEVFVANGPQQSVASLDAKSGDVRFVASLGGQDNIGSVRVTGADGSLWYADPTKHVVGRIRAYLQGGSVEAQIPVPPDRTSLTAAYESIDGFASGGGSLWVAGDALGRELWRLDPTAKRVTATIRLPFVPADVAAGEGAVWVTSLLGDTVARIDLATNRLAQSIHVGRGAGSIATGEGAVWVANSIDGTVSRIDPATNRVVATIPVGNQPGDLAVGLHGIWVTTAHSQPVGISPAAIAIGVLSDCKGRYAQTRDATLAGSELAVIEHGGWRAGPALTDGIKGASIAGHPIRLVFGCSDSTTASALSEARRLVDGVGVQVLIGPLGGNPGLVLQDFARTRPGIAFVNGTSSAQVLRPAPNFFSFHTDGAGWTAGLGTYAYRSLGWRKAVIVADLQDDVFNWTQAAGFVAEFCSLGGTIAKRVWVPAGTEDYSRIIAQVPRSDVDGFFFATYANTVVALARGYPGLRGNISRKVLPGSLPDLGGLQALGRRARGLVGGGAEGAGDFAGYMRRYRREFPRNTTFAGSYFDIFYHDAMGATLDALASVRGDLSQGERRFKAALARVRPSSPLGAIRLDRDRQAIAYNNLYRGNRRIRAIPRVDHTFGGYFTPDDPPPSRTTPVCKHGNPPPWAR